MYPGGFDEEMYDLLAVATSGMVTSLVMSLLSLACYVLMSVAVYTIAKRRELKRPWLAWIPVANSWLLGSIADQYRYVTRGENKSKRKVLLVLSILSTVLSVVICASVVQMIFKTAHVLFNIYNEDQILQMLMGPMMTVLNLILPLLGVALAYIIVYYMTLWDVYQSLDPMNSTVYLVLSILFPVTISFFLFFNRDKENGMPPRKENQPIPAAIAERAVWTPQPEQPPQSVQEPWQPVPERKDPWEN